jgi:hypothetical protein
MDGTNDISFTELDDDTLQKISEFAKEKLSPQQGLLLVIFAAEAASQDVDVDETTVHEIRDVDRLLAKLRKAYMRGKPGTPIPYCIVPVPPPPPPPPPPPRPSPPPRPEPDKPYNQ